MTIIAWASIYGGTNIRVAACSDGRPRLEIGDEMRLRNVTLDCGDIPLDELRAAFAKVIEMREALDVAVVL